MIKIIFCLFFLLIHLSFSKLYNECDTQGQIKCSSEQTCCRSKVSSSGWTCFPGKNGICCSDGISYCPQGTICNLSTRTCNQGNRKLNFDQYNPIDPKNNLNKPSVRDAIIFSRNFIEGIISDQPDYKYSVCLSDSENTIYEFQNIITSLRNYNSYDLFGILKELLTLKNILVNGNKKNSNRLCYLLDKELKNIFERFSKKLYNFSSLMNLDLLKDLIFQAGKSLKNREYGQAGNSFGLAINIVVNENSQRSEL